MKKILIILSLLFVHVGIQAQINWLNTYEVEGAPFVNFHEKLPDGNYFIAFNKSLTGTPSILKVSPEGDIIWERNLGLESGRFMGLRFTADGNMIALIKALDLELIKMDLDANIIWSQAYEYDSSWSVSQNQLGVLSDGGFLISGQIQIGFGQSSDMAILRTDALGNLIWEKQFFFGIDSLAEREVANFAMELNNGNIIVAGKLLNDMAFIQLDADGNLIWEQIIDHEGSSYEVPTKITPSCDPNLFYVSGFLSINNKLRPFLSKMDSEGNEIWSNYYGAGTNAELTSSMHVLDDDGIIMTFCNNVEDKYSGLVVKVDAEGNELCSFVFDAPEMFETRPKSINEEPDGSYFLSGYVVACENSCSDRQIFAMNISSLCANSQEVCISTNLSNTLISDNVMEVAPNPSRGDFKLSTEHARSGVILIKIYNSSGQIMLIKKMNSLEAGEIISFDQNKWRPGLYFVKIEGHKSDQMIKVVVQ